MKNARINLRVRDIDYLALKAIAQRKRVSISEYLRELVGREIEREGKFFPELADSIKELENRPALLKRQAC